MHITLLENKIYKSLLVFCSILLSVVGCCEKQKNAAWAQVVIDPQVKVLVDSVLFAHRNVVITRDTCLGLETMDTAGFVAIQFCNIDTRLLALISVQTSDKGFASVFIFKVLPTGWVYQTSFNIDPYSWGTHKIKLKDVDFDRREDLLIETHIWASRMVELITCFDYNRDNGDIGVVKIRDLSSTDRIDCDERLKTVTCYTDGGNFGTHEKIVYKWNHDTLQAVKRLDKYVDFDAIATEYTRREVLKPSNPNASEEAIYIVRLNEYVLVDDKMEFSRSIEADDPDTYFESWH